MRHSDIDKPVPLKCSHLMRRICIDRAKPPSSLPSGRRGSDATPQSSTLTFTAAQPAGLLLNVDWLAALRRLPEWSTGGVYGENHSLFYSLSPHPDFICRSVCLTDARATTLSATRTLPFFTQDKKFSSQCVSVRWDSQRVKSWLWIDAEITKVATKAWVRKHVNQAKGQNALVAPTSACVRSIVCAWYCTTGKRLNAWIVELPGSLCTAPWNSSLGLSLWLPHKQFYCCTHNRPNNFLVSFASSPPCFS